MIKECLTEIVNSRIDLGDIKKGIIKRYINMYEDEQLFYYLQSGNGLVVEDVNIFYYTNVGFRCSNDMRFGRLPICNIFDRILNEKYKKIIV